MNPSAKARAAGAPVEADISKLEEGALMSVEWRGKPVWVVKRTPKMLADLPTLNDQLADPRSEVPQQPKYAQNANSFHQAEVLVLVGICTHLGCSPTFRPDIAPADLGRSLEGRISSAPATAPVSIWPGGSTRAFPRHRIWWCPPTGI